MLDVDSIFPWWPLSVLVWAVQMAVFHGVGLFFEWSDGKARVLQGPRHRPAWLLRAVAARALQSNPCPASGHDCVPVLGAGIHRRAAFERLAFSRRISTPAHWARHCPICFPPLCAAPA